MLKHFILKGYHVNLQNNTEHPYVEINPKVCNGSSVIEGTRTRIFDVTIEYAYVNRPQTT